MRKSRLLALVLTLIMAMQPFGGIASYAEEATPTDMTTNNIQEVTVELPETQSSPSNGLTDPSSDGLTEGSPSDGSTDSSSDGTIVPPASPTQYTVKFVYTTTNADNNLIKVESESQTVNEGASANPPEVPLVVGNLQFIGWDTDYTCVTGNLIVNALYVNTLPETGYVNVRFV